MTNQPPPPPPPSGSPSSSQAAADVGVRAGARVIDAILLTIVGGIIAAVIFVPLLLADAAATETPGMLSALTGGGLSAASLISSLVGLAINFAYYVGLDTTIGGTLGKKILGLQIIGADGGNPTPAESFKRNAWLLLSVVPVLGSLLQLGAAIYILYTISNDPSNVGWHDRFAGGTRVVKT